MVKCRLLVDYEIMNDEVSLRAGLSRCIFLSG